MLYPVKESLFCRNGNRVIEKGKGKGLNQDIVPLYIKRPRSLPFGNNEVCIIKLICAPLAQPDRASAF